MNNLNENLALEDFRISKYIHGFHVGFIKEAYDISGRWLGNPLSLSYTCYSVPFCCAASGILDCELKFFN